MGIRLEPQDEYMHPLEEATTFNESMYFNLYDPTTELGGFFRVGNRANEGHAEMTVCLYLPDGRVGFMYQRPRISDNDAFDAAGLRFTVDEPFERLTVTYEGSVVLLDDPLEMADPKAAFTGNPHLPCTASIVYTRASDPIGGESDKPEKAGEEFARGHYEQLVAASGTITVGDESWTVDGFGLRDHSWGPRTWQAPYYYRWLTANAGPDFGFMGSRIARRDSDGVRAGFVWEDGQIIPCDGFEISTDWQGEASYHQGITATLRASNAPGGPKEWKITGRVLNLIPLRNRRDGQVTRISEGMTEWTLADGRVGYGLSEYLDQIEDGLPVGLAE
jgi:hypothetical protein